MSVEARRWVTHHSRTSGTLRQVLAELAWGADAQGRGTRRSQVQLAEATGRDRRTVQRALARLESDGHIRRHGDGCGCKDCGKAQRGVVVFDVVLGHQDDVPAGQLELLTGGTVPPPRGGRVTRGGRQGDARHQRHHAAGSSGTVPPLKETLRLNGQHRKGERAGARQPRHDPDTVPESFPTALSQHLDLVVAVLREVAEAKGAAEVHRGAVARTLTPRPRRPVVRAAHDFAAYFLDGKGARRQLQDVVAAYRNWLDREADLQGPEPLPGAAPAARNGGPVPAPQAGEFAKYDVAMGLA